MCKAKEEKDENAVQKKLHTSSPAFRVSLVVVGRCSFLGLNGKIILKVPYCQYFIQNVIVVRRTLVCGYSSVQFSWTTLSVHILNQTLPA